MCELTGERFPVEHPVSLGVSNLDIYLDRQVDILGTVIVSGCQVQDMCLPVKIVKQLLRQKLVSVITKLYVNCGNEDTSQQTILKQIPTLKGAIGEEIDLWSN